MKQKSKSTRLRRRPTLVSRLDGQVGYWLRYVSHQVSQGLSRKIQDKGVTLAEWFVLRALYDGERRPSELAEKMGLTRGAISKLTERMVTNLMITQQADRGGDGRSRILALTELGHATVRVLAALADENEQEFFGELNPNARAALVATLREIVRRHGLRAGPAD